MQSKTTQLLIALFIRLLRNWKHTASSPNRCARSLMRLYWAHAHTHQPKNALDIHFIKLGEHIYYCGRWVCVHERWSATYAQLIKCTCQTGHQRQLSRAFELTILMRAILLERIYRPHKIDGKHISTHTHEKTRTFYDVCCWYWTSQLCVCAQLSTEPDC